MAKIKSIQAIQAKQAKQDEGAEAGVPVQVVLPRGLHRLIKSDAALCGLSLRGYVTQVLALAAAGRLRETETGEEVGS